MAQLILFLLPLTVIMWYFQIKVDAAFKNRNERIRVYKLTALMFGVWSLLLVFSLVTLIVMFTSGLSYSNETNNVLLTLKEVVENKCLDKYMLGGYFPDRQLKDAAKVTTREEHLLDVLLNVS